MVFEPHVHNVLTKGIVAVAVIIVTIAEVTVSVTDLVVELGAPAFGDVSERIFWYNNDELKIFCNTTRQLFGVKLCFNCKTLF